MSATEMEVFRHEITDTMAVSAYIGYGRSVAITIETDRLNLDASMEPNEARDLAAALIAAAEAAEKL